jgi:rare lipoprotein A
MKIIFSIISIMLIILFASCSSSTRFTKENDEISKPTIENPDLPGETINYSNNPPIITETGTASYYAHKFHGRLTANGEIYDMYGLTAAHPTLPLNSVIRVTNLSNDKNLVVRINDRMPQHPSRIIDLSLGTAQKLDMVEDGLAEVKIEVLKMGDNKYKKQK